MPMKRFLLVVFLILNSSNVWGQINLTGSADYKFTISGYQGEDGNACGNDYGLREVYIFYEDGQRETLWSGRIWNQGFNHEKLYSKNRKIVKVEMYSINMWYRWPKRCRGRANHHRHSLPVGGTCFKQFHEKTVHVTENVTVKSFPEYNIDFDPNTQYFLGDDKNLTISLPDNLEEYDYVWKYSVNGVTNEFSNKHNYKPILDVPAKEFIQESDYGKVVSVWVESSCNMDGEIKKSNIFNFIVLKSAPEFISHQVTEPNCFDDKGTVKFNFDRMLLPDEEAEFVLNGEYLKDINPSLNQDLVNQLRVSTSITFPNAEHGTHNLKIVGTYKGNPTYSGKEQIREFSVTPPTPVIFSVTSSQNVYCYGGNDGYINLSASGGVGTYQYTLDNGISWIDFDQSNTTQIPNLQAGTYNIKVRDSHFCVAKENTQEKQVSIKIQQPNDPISLNDIEIVQPKGYGLSNGYIVLTVKGGTPKPNKTYHYEWRKDSPNGAILSTIEISPDTSNGFTFKLSDITAGKYYLTVKDHNFAQASSSLNTCGIISQEFIVEQPDPLTTQIEVSKKISCHIDNQYEYKLDLNSNNTPDEAEDGNLSTQTKGGVAPYSYQWQKEINGVFQNINGETNSELLNQGIGKYRILIEDANKNKAQADYIFIYPSQLNIQLTGQDLLCYGESNASAQVKVTGGTGNYSYRWNNLEKTAQIQNISAGNYFVLVSDENHCKVKGSIIINEPEEIIITDILVQDPLSPKATNGQIQFSLQGGKAPYTVSWSNGMTGEQISGLSEGTYTATIQDANQCITTKTYTLTDPERLPLDLGEDIVTLCLGDTKTYNVKINDPLATYTWTDTHGNIISDKPTITLSTSGIYTITIVNSKGNTASDSVEIKLSNEILNPEFLITTHAYVEAPVKLVNTSSIPPQKVEWIIPQNQGIKVISQSDEYLEVLFPNTGAYTFGLKGIQGDCEKIFYKDIIVEENIAGIELTPKSISNIKEFIIAPNPNPGQYKVFIKLHKAEAIKLRMLDMVSHEVLTPVIKPKATEFEIPFNTNLPSSVYLIILESAGESQVKKIIIAQ